MARDRNEPLKDDTIADLGLRGLKKLSRSSSMRGQRPYVDKLPLEEGETADQINRPPHIPTVREERAFGDR